MILIGENLHIISKTVRTALSTRDEAFVLDLLEKQKNMDYVDLNVGPAKKDLEGVLPWLSDVVQKNFSINISFDTTNHVEMENGLKSFKSPQNAIINSTSADEIRLEKMTDLAAEYGSSLIALTLSNDIGIPKTADGRLELAYQIFEKCAEKGIENNKIFFDPLILPVCVDQAQAFEALNTIQMIKQCFDPPVLTTVGLSNISNGAPRELRPFINQVFMVLAMGAGLDSAIIDALDLELVRIVKMVENNAPLSPSDELLVNLYSMMQEFSEIEDISFEPSCEKSKNIYKCARILLNKDIYSHSFTQV